MVCHCPPFSRPHSVQQDRERLPAGSSLGGRRVFRCRARTEASRAALLANNDVDDDEVDRWYRHVYRYTEVESLRRYPPPNASIDALLSAGYPDGLAHVDARIPDQNEEVKKTLVVYGDPKYAETLTAIAFPMAWLDLLSAAVAKSEASFKAYQATFSDASTAVSLGRDEEASWVLLARALDHTIKLRSLGADPSVVEEGKALIAPLTNAVRLLRSEAGSRSTKREKKGAKGSPPEASPEAKPETP